MQGVSTEPFILLLFVLLVGGSALSRVLTDQAQAAAFQHTCALEAALAHSGSQAAPLQRQRDVLRLQAHLLGQIGQAVVATDPSGVVNYRIYAVGAGCRPHQG